LIIPTIIHTILLDPSIAVWTDEASNMSRPDPSGALQVDALKHHGPGLAGCSGGVASTDSPR
jgi:hypothetical protein